MPPVRLTKIPGSIVVVVTLLKWMRTVQEDGGLLPTMTTMNVFTDTVLLCGKIHCNIYCVWSPNNSVRQDTIVTILEVGDLSWEKTTYPKVSHLQPGHTAAQCLIAREEKIFHATSKPGKHWMKISFFKLFFPFPLARLNMEQFLTIIGRPQ